MDLLEVAKSRVGDQLPLSFGVLPELALRGEMSEHDGSLVVLFRLLLLRLEFALKHYLLPFQIGNSLLLLLLFCLVILDLGIRAPSLGASLEPNE